MPLYEKPVPALMWDMVADLKLAKADVITRDQVLEWFARHYPKVKEGTIGAVLIRLSTNARSPHHYSAKPKDDDLFYQIDGARFRLYDPERDPQPLYEQPPAARPAQNENTQESEPPREFAYETDLRNYLAKNLSLLEPGLKLYEDEGISGIEFPAGGAVHRYLGRRFPQQLRGRRAEGVPRVRPSGWSTAQVHGLDRKEPCRSRAACSWLRCCSRDF